RGSCTTARRITCSLDALGAGETATVTVVVQVMRAGSIAFAPQVATTAKDAALDVAAASVTLDAKASAPVRVAVPKAKVKAKPNTAKKPEAAKKKAKKAPARPTR